MLGVVFPASGEVANENWRTLQEKAEKRLNVATSFNLSFQERSYVIKACVSAAFFYVARVARPPRHVLRNT